MFELHKADVPLVVPTFQFGTIHVPHFIHSHNVYHPPYRMTERSIELAVADIYLNKYNREEVVEIGAVTPYYWPHRIPTIIDPSDKHRLVTVREEWHRVEICAKAILSISTFEHIGLPDYGLEPDVNRLKTGLEKLLITKADFLITWSGGYNRILDQYARQLADYCQLYVWQRNHIGNDWVWSNWRDLDFSSFCYGPFWGNTLIMIHRGAPLWE